MQAAALACLLALAPQERGKLADDFVAAFKVNDRETMAVLASRPAKDVEYAWELFRMLQMGEDEAAQKLVELREGAPEYEGMKRQLAAPVPTKGEELAWIAAEQRVQQPAKCLEVLERAGTPVAGSVHGARILYTRARALILDQRQPEALDALAQCAKHAEACGWLLRQRRAEELRSRLAAKDPKHLLAAYNGLVVVLKQLDDRPAELRARARRAGLLFKAGKLEEGRKDLRRAITLAHALKQEALEGQLWCHLANHFHTTLREPRQALKFYDEGLKILRKLKPALPLQQALLNSAIVLTELARYGEALKRLDELLASNVPGQLRQLAVKQRAYVLLRHGSVNKSREAHKLAMSHVKDPLQKLELRLGLARVEVLRGDLRAAEAHFTHVLEQVPKHVPALAGRGGVRAMRGNRAGAEADFAAALSVEHTGQMLLKRASARRQLGMIPQARIDAARALKTLIEAFESKDTARIDYGNTAAAYVLLADLLLLEGNTKRALQQLEKAAVFFYKLQDAGRAIPAYARWTLTLTDPDSVLQRFQTLNNIASGTKYLAMKSYAKCVEAFLHWKAEAPDKAAAAWQEALDIAVEAKSREQEASALAHLALVKGAGPALKALALLEAERLDGPQRRPFVAGESAEYAASIALRSGNDPALAFSLVERARADRLLVALGGRAAVLDSMLSNEQYGRYVAAHSALAEARAEREGVADAERAFDAMVDEMRSEAPEAAAIAFPRAPALADAQKRLRPDEALLLMLADPWVKRRVLVTPGGASVSELDPRDPLKDLRLEGVKKLIVVPDGSIGLAASPWKKGKALEAFQIFYVPTAARFVRLRDAAPNNGEGARRVGDGPGRLPAGPARGRVRVLHIGTPAPIHLRFPEATPTDMRIPTRADAVVLAGAVVKRGGAERADGVAAAAEALLARGTRQVVIPLVGAPPAKFWDRFYVDCLDNGMTPGFALLLARRAIRKEAENFWAGVVVWGVPAQ